MGLSAAVRGWAVHWLLLLRSGDVTARLAGPKLPEPGKRASISRGAVPSLVWSSERLRGTPTTRTWGWEMNEHSCFAENAGRVRRPQPLVGVLSPVLS